MMKIHMMITAPHITTLIAMKNTQNILISTKAPEAEQTAILTQVPTTRTKSKMIITRTNVSSFTAPRCEKGATNVSNDAIESQTRHKDNRTLTTPTTRKRKLAEMLDDDDEQQDTIMGMINGSYD